MFYYFRKYKRWWDLPAWKIIKRIAFCRKGKIAITIGKPSKPIKSYSLISLLDPPTFKRKRKGAHSGWSIRKSIKRIQNKEISSPVKESPQKVKLKKIKKSQFLLITKNLGKSVSLVGYQENQLSLPSTLSSPKCPNKQIPSQTWWMSFQFFTITQKADAFTLPFQIVDPKIHRGNSSTKDQYQAKSKAPKQNHWDNSPNSVPGRPYKYNKMICYDFQK